MRRLRRRLYNLDAQRPDMRVHAVETQLAGRPHDVLLALVDHADEGVGDAQVRVLPEREHEEELAFGVVAAEVVAVVEIAVAGGRIGHRFGDLVDEVIVET